MLLKDKACIVSGVGPGLGSEIALAFAREGCAVGVNDIRPEAAEAVVAEVRAGGGEASPLPADVAIGARTEECLQAVQREIESRGRRAVYATTDITKPDQCDRLVATTVDAFGKVDVLVHNAAMPDVRQPFEDVDLDEWRRIMDTNLFGTLQLTKSVIPAMRA